MNINSEFKPIGYSASKDGRASGVEFMMVFQPIVILESRSTFRGEVLVRGLNNESAFSRFSQINNDNRFSHVGKVLDHQVLLVVALNRPHISASAQPMMCK